MFRVFIVLAAIAAFLAVALGAFGAHGLKSILTPPQLETYRTGVEYQMWHALGLGLIGLLLERYPDRAALIWAGWLMFGGIVLFSGSLYLLTLTSARWLGAITPFGGVAFLAAWLLLAIVALQLKGSKGVQNPG